MIVNNCNRHVSLVRIPCICGLLHYNMFNLREQSSVSQWVDDNYIIIAFLA